MRGRFLITTWDGGGSTTGRRRKHHGGGNTTPAYHLALRLRRRGHDVLLLGRSAMAGRAGRPVVCIPQGRDQTLSSSLSGRVCESGVGS